MILDRIIESTKIRVSQLKENYALDVLKEQAKPLNLPFLFEEALRINDIAFICEVKKASPSKGIIAVDFPYVQIAREYEAAGANAISVLTEPEFFQGANAFLIEIKENVNIPLLRKDFVIDESQIYESRIIGADAILLICSILDEKTIRHFIKTADDLGMSCLVEAHNEVEVQKAMDSGARVIGVNNRNLKTFDVDIKNSVRLRKMVPPKITFVSESGINTPEDIEIIRENGTNAVLIGEILMRSGDKSLEIKKLKGFD